MWSQPNTSDTNHGIFKTRVTKSLTVLHLHCIGNDLSSQKNDLHKSYTERIKPLNFGKFFKDDHIQKLNS